MSGSRPTFSLGSPGYSVETLLEHAPEPVLANLLGQDVVTLLKTLDLAFADLSALRAAAKRMVDPLQALSTDRTRDAVIGALPLAKAEELARRADIRVSRDPFSALLDKQIGVTSTAARWRALLDFFGLEPNRPERSEKAVEDLVGPAYALFDHQNRAAMDAGTRLSAYPHRVLMHMPTGAGKTRTAMHVVARHMSARPKTSVCWLASSQELLEQAADEFGLCWRNLGSHPVRLVRFWGGAYPPERFDEPSFVVAGFAKLTSLASRDPNLVLALADAASLTVVDEAHQAIAPTYHDAIETLVTKRPGSALLGLSATPGRTWADVAEDAKLAEFFGGQKVTLRVDGYKDPVNYLIDQGYLARPHFRTLNGAPGLALSDVDLADLGAGLDIPEAVLSRLAGDQQRNLRILAEIEALSRRHPRIIIFAATVAHAHLLATVLNIRGIMAFAIDGTTSHHERARAIRRFRGDDPSAMVMCNFGVLTTGFDAPRTGAAIIARPTMSLVLYSQMIGRAIRGPRAGGNATADIVTVVDPSLAGFGDMSEAFTNWEDVWNGGS